MTDRELEDRLRALYRGRVPAKDVAPLDLRSELVAITRGPSPSVRFGDSRAWAALAAAALLGAMLIGGALVAGSGLMRLTALVPPRSPVPNSATATPVQADAPHFFGGWRPKDNGLHPAGIYWWDPFGDHGFIHKVPEGSGRSGSVELRFRMTTQANELEAMAAALAPYGEGPHPEHPIEIPGLVAVQAWIAEDGTIVGRPAPGESPFPSAYETTQTWMMDMAGQAVAIDLTTYPDTTPALLAEAEAVIRSVRPRQRDGAATPAPSSYPSPFHGFVFELTPGWDAN